MPAKLAPPSAGAGPDRKGTSWSGLLTLSGDPRDVPVTRAEQGLVRRGAGLRLVHDADAERGPLLGGELGGGLTGGARRGVVEEGHAERLAVLGTHAVGTQHPAGRVEGGTGRRGIERRQRRGDGVAGAGDRGQRREGRGGRALPAGEHLLRAGSGRAPWVSAMRTAGSAPGRPSAWLNHISPMSTSVVDAEQDLGATRWASGPTMVAALTSPVSIRLAAVAGFSTMRSTTVPGSPSVRAAPSGSPRVAIADGVGVVVTGRGLAEHVGPGAEGRARERCPVRQAGGAHDGQVGQAVEHEGRRRGERDGHRARRVIGHGRGAGRVVHAQEGAQVGRVRDVVEVGDDVGRGQRRAVGAGDALGQGERDRGPIDRPVRGELGLDRAVRRAPCSGASRTRTGWPGRARSRRPSAGRGCPDRPRGSW